MSKTIPVVFPGEYNSDAIQKLTMLFTICHSSKRDCDPRIYWCCTSKSNFCNSFPLLSPALLVLPQLLNLFNLADLMSEFIMLRTMSRSLFLFEPEIVKSMHIFHKYWLCTTLHVSWKIMGGKKRKRNPTYFLVKYPVSGFTLFHFALLHCVFHIQKE